MHRFIALAWNEHDDQSEKSARSIEFRFKEQNQSTGHTTYRSSGLTVIHATDASSSFRSYELSNHQGIVLGRIFRNTRGKSGNTVFSEADTNRILESKARSLIRDYWGAYIAFIVDPSTGKYILRDPTGAIHCYSIQLNAMTLFFSDISDYFALFSKPLNINWRHISSYLCFSRLIGDQTGFEEITQIRAGECKEINGSKISSSFYWNPASICEEQPLENVDEAISSIREVVTNSVQNWASCYSQILLELSGGLDSSIVLSCLANAQPRPEAVCLNMYTEIPEGDERIFARKAISQTNFELIETVFRSGGRALEKVLDTEVTVSPTCEILHSESGDVRSDIAKSRGINAVFSGRGGDQLFQRRRGNFIATEYVHRHGLGSKLLRVIMETTHLTGTSIWPVLSAAIKYRILKHRPSPYSVIQIPAFLQRDCIHSDSERDFQHPWVMDAKHLPESKSQQIFDLIDTQSYFTAERCEYADFIPALISQPIIECVLKIPSYLLTLGGRERGLLRQAFSNNVPSEIIHRKAKGLTINYFQDMIRDNLSFVREFLLDGSLNANGIINRSFLEASLTSDRLIRGTEIISLLSLIKAENWLRLANRTGRLAAR